MAESTIDVSPVFKYSLEGVYGTSFTIPLRVGQAALIYSGRAGWAFLIIQPAQQENPTIVFDNAQVIESATRTNTGVEILIKSNTLPGTRCIVYAIITNQ